MNHYSPLRYPGGKTRLADFMEDVILLNNLEDCTLYELYAGGAGASLNILFNGLCSKLVLNDLDVHIYAFWRAVLHETESLIKLIEQTPVNLTHWYKQKDVYLNPGQYTTLEVGFSTFFLNRCNRSGILFKAGPIGGYKQTGNYKMDVRYNKQDLVKRIEAIASYQDQIVLHNEESINLLRQIFNNNAPDQFIFLDPPYFNQGEQLYLNCYQESDHQTLSNLLKAYPNANWLLTYDNVPAIHEVYNQFRKADLPMSYTLQEKTQANEIVTFSDNLYIPQNLRMGNKWRTLNFIEN